MKSEARYIATANILWIKTPSTTTTAFVKRKSQIYDLLRHCGFVAVGKWENNQVKVRRMK